MMRDGAIACKRADPNSAIGEFLNAGERLRVNVDELGGLLDTKLHQVYKSCSARDERAGGFSRNQRDHIVFRSSSNVVKRSHARSLPFPIASRTARTILA